MLQSGVLSNMTMPPIAFSANDDEMGHTMSPEMARVVVERDYARAIRSDWEFIVAELFREIDAYLAMWRVIRGWE